MLCEPRFLYVLYVTNTTWKDWPIKKIDIGIREIGIDIKHFPSVIAEP